MKKSIILLALILTSCATKKVTDTETEVKTETEKNTTIDISKFSNSFTLEPMDLEKPILLGKDTLYNTRVIYNNTKEIVKEKSKESEKVDLKEEKREKEKDYTKVIESVSNRLFWLILIIFAVYQIISFVKKKVSL